MTSVKLLFCHMSRECPEIFGVVFVKSSWKEKLKSYSEKFKRNVDIRSALTVLHRTLSAEYLYIVLVPVFPIMTFHSLSVMNYPLSF